MKSALGPGAQLGPYSIFGEIGRGGVGRILKARHVGLDRVVALKLLADDVASDPAVLERFTKEARAAARLNHPNIVQVYDFGTLEGRPFLALEFVDGAPLSETVELYGPLGEKDALTVVRQVAGALAVAHEAGIVHRDIKPDNLMVTPEGVVKLVDLGLAKLYRDDPLVSSPGIVSGTPRYMSPEQIEEREDLDGRTDIYSLGVTLFYLLTGRPAFEGPPGAVLSAHLSPVRPDPRDHVPGLSEGTRRLVLRMFARLREDRVRDARLLGQEVDALLSALDGRTAA